MHILIDQLLVHHISELSGKVGSHFRDELERPGLRIGNDSLGEIALLFLVSIRDEFGTSRHDLPSQQIYPFIEAF